MKKRRDAVLDSITGADVQQIAQIVDNPLIGKIPTREELADELDELLMCM